MTLSRGLTAHTHSSATDGGANIIQMPSGSIIKYGGTVAPTGWLLCNGAAVSRTTYADLFAAIGVVYGAGDGNTTFNVPDNRGRAVVGAGQGAGLTNRAQGATGGAETHTLTEAQLPTTIAKNAAGETFTTPGTSSNYVFNTGGGQSHNIMQPFIVHTFIIKT